MPLLIRTVGDWGGAERANVAAVAQSVADAFPVFDDVATQILLEPVARDDDSPITLFEPTPAGEIVVRLNVRGNLWARLAYQFAHELCHVTADPTTFVLDRFTWIEEALCETASLFALRAMARTWVEAPPYPNWRDYAPSLASYAAERMDDPAHTLPDGVRFHDWLRERLPTLEAHPGERALNTVIAKELLPVFENDPSAWLAVRELHTRRPDLVNNLAAILGIA